MQREEQSIRPDYPDRLIGDGVNYQGLHGSFWYEDRAYLISEEECRRFELAAEQAYEMLTTSLEFVIQERRLTELGIPTEFHELISTSWRKRDPSMFSRLDFVQDKEGAFKLLECNGDTPITLLETGDVQERWMRECHPGSRQCNQLVARIVDAMARIFPIGQKIHFLTSGDAVEELDNIQYLRRLAIAAGHKTALLRHDDFAWHEATQSFLHGSTGDVLSAVCKLYPWEWLLEDLSPRCEALSKVAFLEPAWKIPLCSKGILAILWELFPNHEILVPAYSNSPRSLTQYVAKPLYGRKGDSLMLVHDGSIVSNHDGAYSKQNRVFQQVVDTQTFGAWRCTLGAWIVSGEPAGIGIRESREFLMREESICVPHLIV